MLAAIDDEATSRCVQRRAGPARGALGGDCHSAIAARAVIDGDAVRLDAEILSADGREVCAGSIRLEDGSDAGDSRRRAARPRQPRPCARCSADDLPLLILRPQPGADETAARARALGLSPIVAPLFIVRGLAWAPPPAAEFDAIMLTSANAARRAGAGLAAFLGLPCYAVGDATAAAASDAGFTDVRIGPEDGVALLMTMEGDGVVRALHPCGADHMRSAGSAVLWP